MRGVEIRDSGMQTTPWRGSNCRDPCCSSSTTGYRQPLVGFFRQIWRSWRTPIAESQLLNSCGSRG